MNRLNALIHDLSDIEQRIIQTIRSVIENNEPEIVELNSEDQLFLKGINRRGISIMDYAPYSPVTISIKRGKGQPTNRVTLRDSQDFHNSFYIEFDAESFEIVASDWKTYHLEKEYGEEIFGLTDENFNNIAEYYVKPAIIKLFKRLGI